MSLFIIEDLIVRPSPSTLLIYPFREIWERDKTKHKEIASKEFSYVEFLCSYSKDNPYAGYDDDVKEKMVIEGVFRDSKWKPDKLVKDAVTAYISFRDEASPSLRFYLSAVQGVHKMIEYYNTLDMNERTRNGMLVNKSSEVARGLAQTSQILANLEALKQKVQQELYETSKSRGNRNINPFER